MNTDPLEPLRTFRAGVYAALGQERNELFDLVDAIASIGPVPSLAHVSLAPAHRGGHARLYRALARGGVDVPALRALVAAPPFPGGEALFAIDASPWPRPDAVTSPARGFCHHASRHQAYGQPVVPGWNYQWLAELRWTQESWTAPLEVVRVPPHGNANTTAVAQVQRLLQEAWQARGPFPRVPLVVLDAGYDATQLGVGLAAELAAGQIEVLVRVRADRCFYTAPAPLPAGSPGRPRVHGARFACADARTWWATTAEYTTTDAPYGQVRVRAWAGLHGIPRDHAGRVRRVPGGPDRRGHVPLLRGTLLLVEVGRLPGRTSAPKPLWLFWQGAGEADLGRLWQAYVRRFDVEHMFRFDKQTLNWVVPRLRTPAQADTWTWLVLLAYTELRLAQPLVADCHLPWQRPLPPEQLTPGRVRQGFSSVCAALGSPAAAPKPRGHSPGRPRGHRSTPAPRFDVVKVGRPRPTKRSRCRAQAP